MGRVEDPEYIAWIKTLPCCNCYGQGGEAHHLKGIHHLSGGSRKAHDLFSVPLCYSCHEAFHKGRIDPNDQNGWLLGTLDKGVRSGMIRP